MTIRQRAMQTFAKVAEPVAIRAFRWLGDPGAQLVGPTAKSDPYPIYERLRARGGLLRSRFGFWIATGYAEASEVIRHPDFVVDPASVAGAPPHPEPGDVPEIYETLLGMDPPDHSRVRRLVGASFGIRSVAALEPFTAEAAAQLLD